jgi:two-component system cell cycle sensor histidine kinase/response regulator CckA
MNVMAQFPATRDFDRDLCFRMMFERAAIGIAICQLDGRILDANPALAKMLGYSPQELICDHAAKLSAENFSQHELLVAELIGENRESFEIEKWYRRKDGSDLWGHLTMSLARDTNQHPAFLIALLADATDHKEVSEHLRETEKMEVMGRLAGGIAHDFNNLLTGILLYCDLLTARLGNDGSGSKKSEDNHPDGGSPNGEFKNEGKERCELRQHVEEMRMAGEQGAALTHQLLAIARKQRAERRPVPINEVVTSTKNLLQMLIGEQIQLVISLDSALQSGAGLVLADPAQLRQVLMNLVLNARDAMPHGGKIVLSTCVSKPRTVSLMVRDTGCGMEAETRTRLFEPFFTTKQPGAGTGLGMATVHRIVSEAQGSIEIESEPGCGTTIEVVFPAVDLPIGLTANSVGQKA